MVRVGLIGLSPVWETRYRPALKRLGERISVRAVYDPVTGRAEAVAADFGARVASGILSLIERDDADAYLLLDRAWQGMEALQLIRRAGKPVYIAGSLGEDLETIKQLHEASISEGIPLVPEFSRRYTPATARLQELFATQLGRPVQIEIATCAPARDDETTIPGQGPGHDFFIGWFDWCRYLVRTPPGCVESVDDRTVHIEYRQGKSGGVASSVKLRIDEPSSDAEKDEQQRNCQQITCECGWVVLKSDTSIEWQAEGEAVVAESLSHDRPEVEVMLDHFCRRVVGGLIPVADLLDICRSLHLVRSLEESRKIDRPVHLNGEA
jgi:predicted dehydrogenase